jgi:hypothetical protein
LKTGQSIPSPQDPQAYYKLLVGGPKLARIGPRRGASRSVPASALTDAFRDAVDRAGRRLGEARRRLAA